MLYAFVSWVKCPHQLIQGHPSGYFCQSISWNFSRSFFSIYNCFLSLKIFWSRILELPCSSDISGQTQNLFSSLSKWHWALWLGYAHHKKCSLQNMYALTFYLLISSIKWNHFLGLFLKEKLFHKWLQPITFSLLTCSEYLQFLLHCCPLYCRWFLFKVDLGFTLAGFSLAVSSAFGTPL